MRAADGSITPVLTLVGGQHRWRLTEVEAQLRALPRRDKNKADEDGRTLE